MEEKTNTFYTDATDNRLQSQDIRAYLQSIWTPEGNNNYSVPSLDKLSETLDCSQMDIYDALRLIQKDGYDYELQGIDSPILIWQKDTGG